MSQVVDYKLPKKIKQLETGEDIDNPFEGAVKISMPRPKERFKIARELQFKTDDKGEVVARDNIEQAEMLYELAEKNIVELKVKHKKSKAEFSSIEELEIYQEGVQLINEVGAFLIGGIRLGNA